MKRNGSERGCFVRLVAGALLGISASESHAQEVLGGDARWTWQASLDGGSSWLGGLVQVASPSQTVRVRGVVTFPAVPNGYFGAAAFDAVVEGQGNSGASDTASGFSRGQTTAGGGVASIGTARFGNVLKIDDINFDNQPPGLGPSWLLMLQLSPTNLLSPPSYANPITAFEFSLNLDATTGDRLIYASRPSSPVFNLQQFIVSYRNSIDSQFARYWHPLVEDSLTLRVIPAPGAFAVLLAAPLLARRRRSTV